jgi:alanine dehydrogenase
VPYALQIASQGYKKACLKNPSLLQGINTLNGFVTYAAVADAHGLTYADATTLLEQA